MNGVRDAAGGDRGLNLVRSLGPSPQRARSQEGLSPSAEARR